MWLVWCAAIIMSSVPGDSDLPSSQLWSVACQTRAVGGVIRGTREWTTSNTITNDMYVMISMIDQVSPLLWLHQFVVSVLRYVAMSTYN